MVSFGSNLGLSLPHIQVRDLYKTYTLQGETVQALKNINLDIPHGKILGIIGKSGAGKSSLLRCLNGLESPSSGSIYIQQQKLTELDHTGLLQLRRKMGMIFQHFNLMSAKTVSDNIALPLKVAGFRADQIRERVNEVLSIVDLQEKSQHYPAQLSGGQKQRVGIARALVHHPEILLCDEATSALDTDSTSTVLKLLKEINQKLGITIVLITHEMQVIRDLCDFVAVIDQGEIVEKGFVWSIFSNPQQHITRELLNLEYCKLPFALTSNIQNDSTHLLIKFNVEFELQRNIDIYQLIDVFQTSVIVYQSHVTNIQNHSIGTWVIGLALPIPPSVRLQEKIHPTIHHMEILGYARTY